MPNVKPRPRLRKLGDRRPQLTEKGPDGSYSYEHPQRFKTVSELHTRWEKVRKKRGYAKSWLNILRAYERYPYKDAKTGAVRPNFGQLRYRIDQAITGYVDFVTERDTWARITTLYSPNDVQNKEWGELVGTAFQRFCIKPWKKKFAKVLLGVRDMLLYSKGALHWPSYHGVYPESLPIQAVFPDEDAGSFPEEFDLLFIEKSYTAVELFMKVEDAQSAEINGWRRDEVLQLIRGQVPSFKNDSLSEVFRRFQEGLVHSDDEDRKVHCILAYVREYKEDGDGNRISEFVFPKGGELPKEGNDGFVSDDGYLMVNRRKWKCFENIIALLAHSVTRNFYEDPSLAQLIYTVCQNYDIVMNRVLEAVEDNMRLILQTDNTEQMKKIQKMRWGGFQVVDPDVKLQQTRIERPVKDAVDVVRRLMIDQDSGTGKHLAHEEGVGKTPKTAQQAFIDSQESAKIGSAQLKLFNAFFTLVLAEMFRRWTTKDLIHENDEGYDNWKKFRNWLRNKGVPNAAYDPENVVVESVLNLGASNMQAKIQGSRIILETLQVPARTPGEHRAQRDAISAVVGSENVDSYLPPETGLPVKEDQAIGLENDALADASGDPSWVVVHPDDLHMRHIPKHIEARAIILDKARQLFFNLEQLASPQDQGIILNTVQDLMIGSSNLGAHTIAHIATAARGSTNIQQAQLKDHQRNFKQLDQAQQELEAQVGAAVQERMESGAQQQVTDLEFQHKARMFQMEEEHTANMSGLKFRDAEMKGEQLRSQSAENSTLKSALEVQKAQFQKEIEIIQAQIKNIRESNAIQKNAASSKG